MAHLPPIVADLAMILLVAGITTILFKKLNQPLVLGYIIAGFITGPHFNFFPTVELNHLRILHSHFEPTTNRLYHHY